MKGQLSSRFDPRAAAKKVARHHEVPVSDIHTFSFRWTVEGEGREIVSVTQVGKRTVIVRVRRVKPPEFLHVAADR